MASSRAKGCDCVTRRSPLRSRGELGVFNSVSTSSLGVDASLEMPWMAPEPLSCADLRAWTAYQKNPRRTRVLDVTPSHENAETLQKQAPNAARIRLQVRSLRQ